MRKELNIISKDKEILSPNHTALILVDMQVDFCQDDGLFAKAGRDISNVKKIIPNIQKILNKAREKGVLIVHIQECTLPNQLSDNDAWIAFKTRDKKSPEYTLLGSKGMEIINELIPIEDEVVVRKFRPSAFHGTFLNQILHNNNIRTALIVGNTTEGCVLATALDASFHDYYTCLVEDCIASSVDRMHDAAIILLRNRYKIYSTKELLKIWNSQK